MDEYDYEEDYTGGNESSINVFADTVNHNWYYIVGVIVVLILLYFMFFKEHFGVRLPYMESNLPWTAGAGLRTQSVDSSSNRGYSSMPWN